MFTQSSPNNPVSGGRRLPARLVVLISGRGSNLKALLEHPDHGAVFQVHAVISNKADAAGLNLARERGIPAQALSHRDFANRDAFDSALAELVDAHQPALVVLAGFMRILTDGFVNRYAGRLINIHPSLLPAFPGLDTHARAIAAGCRLHGATVHFVTPQLDHGPVIAQAAVEVLHADTPDTLAARVLVREHDILPAAIRAFALGHLHIEGLRVRWSVPAPAVFSKESD